MSETVGVRIEKLASAKGLPTGEKLAALFGVQYETLRKWKSGGTSPNRNRQVTISEVLGVAPEVYMHGAAGAAAGEPLHADEARLLRAYRRILTGDKAKALKDLELRAREIEELELRVMAERSGSSSGESGKRHASAR